jgi:hypothetical protein
MKKTVLILLGIYITLLLVSCSSDNNGSINPSEVITDFSSNEVEALRKYEDKRLVFENLIIMIIDERPNGMQWVFINDDGVSYSNGYGDLYCIFDSNIELDYIKYREIDISGDFSSYNDDKSISLENCTIDTLHDTDNELTVSELSEMNLNKYYKLAYKTLTLEGYLFREKGKLWLGDDDFKYFVKVNGVSSEDVKNLSSDVIEKRVRVSGLFLPQYSNQDELSLYTGNIDLIE